MESFDFFFFLLKEHVFNTNTNTNESTKHNFEFCCNRLNNVAKINETFIKQIKALWANLDSKEVGLSHSFHSSN